MSPEGGARTDVKACGPDTVACCFIGAEAVVSHRGPACLLAERRQRPSIDLDGVDAVLVDDVHGVGDARVTSASFIDHKGLCHDVRGIVQDKQP